MLLKLVFKSKEILRLEFGFLGSFLECTWVVFVEPLLLFLVVSLELFSFACKISHVILFDCAVVGYVGGDE